MLGFPDLFDRFFFSFIILLILAYLVKQRWSSNSFFLFISLSLSLSYYNFGDSHLITVEWIRRRSRFLSIHSFMLLDDAI